MATTPRLPTRADFPQNLTVDIIPPPQSQQPLNILILLHGLGDTQLSFTSLARNLNLPYTCSLSLLAPSPLPSLLTGSSTPSFHWGDDILFDDQTGEIDLDAGFQTSNAILRHIVEEGLVQKCGFKYRQIMFLGFGQGGMAALSYLATASTSSEPTAKPEFGGMISIGGPLPSSTISPQGKNPTPILVCGSSKSTQITRSAIDNLRSKLGEVEYVKWEKEGDSMPRNREEMVSLMKFFSRRLGSRSGVPEGAVEI